MQSARPPAAQALSRTLGGADPWTWGLAALFLAAVVLRWIYARHMPITNDEGASLYDALHITRGVVPYRDFLTKAPLLMYTLAGSVAFFGRSILVGRLTVGAN